MKLPSLRKAATRPVSQLVKASSAGDTLVAEWHPGTEAEEEAARREFDEIIRNGYLAYTGPDKGESRKISSFEPQAERIVVIPPLAGG